MLAEEHVPPFLVDGTFARVVALTRRGTGKPLAPLRIELTRRRADEAMLARHFRCEVRFDAPSDLLVLEESARGEPFVTSNDDLLEAMIPGLEAALEKGRMTRTLQRRLEEAGTTYQRLLDEVRRQAARRLLASTDLDAGEVAFLLGFEELNSFTRAFQAWEGTTPTRWRASDPNRNRLRVAGP